MRRILLVLLALAACAGATARADDPDERFYEEALAAAAAGETARAQAMLETLLARQPGHAGAWLDLALLYCQRGERDAAQAILRRVDATFTPPQALRQLIAEQATAACRPRGPTLRGGVALGYDNNVNLGSGTDRVRLASDFGIVDVLLAENMRPRGDAFLEGWIEGGWRRGGYDFSAGALARRHGQEQGFDQSGLGLAAGRAWQGATVSGQLQVRLGRTWLGGAPFLDTLSLHAEGVQQSLWHGAQPAAGLTLSRLGFPRHHAFDADVLEGRVGLIRAQGDAQVAAWLLASADLARGARPGGDRLGVGAELSGRWRLSPRVQASAMLRVQPLSDAQPYFPPVFDLRRRQTAWHGRAEVTVGLGGNWLWQTRWNARRSQNNLEFLDYDGHVLQTGLVANF